MGHSIQDYLRKINGRLSASDAVSVAVASFFLVILALYLVEKDRLQERDIVFYHEELESAETDVRPFASKNGPTYTYFWCAGADRVKAENRIFFRDAEEAERSGRTLSKLCQR